ncbi:MAG: BlaI/MecI/CopY family transcriptional regulator [Candidatus Limnocylindria bacterium]
MPKRELPRAFTDRLDRPTGRPEEWFLGSLQTRILQTLSKRGPSTVREVADALKGKLAYTTVMTVLGRLHEKGLVGREQRGKGYTYTPRFSEAELRDRMAKYLVDEIVEDFGDVALAHFAGALDRLDRKRVARLRRAKPEHSE